MGKEIKVIELFAGVGGFRLGLEGWNGKSASSGYTKPLVSNFKVVWSNQWEPSTKSQDASDIYTSRFGQDGHSNEDIAKVEAHNIPNHELLVGGFPCQDYSVARTLSQSGGLQGKKGVLWWEIHRILKAKIDSGSPVGYIFLENVDRLLKSPVKQRGRDFAIILASLSDLGYGVEWRVINAADYGMPQRRRRTFILGFHESTPLFETLEQQDEKIDIISSSGIFANSFPVSDEIIKVKNFTICGDLAEITEEFSSQANQPSPFENSGTMFKRQVCSAKTTPKFEGKRLTLGDILVEESKIPAAFYIDEASLDRWNYFKGAKREMRINKASGFEYSYNEGGMIFPDPLDTPSRTIITGEGGASPSRFKHVVLKNGRYRRLIPIELERLNMFPDNHTLKSTEIKRAFFMGNALVVGVIEKVGQVLMDKINSLEEISL